MDDWKDKLEELGVWRIKHAPKTPVGSLEALESRLGAAIPSPLVQFLDLLGGPSAFREGAVPVNGTFDSTVQVVFSPAPGNIYDLLENFECYRDRMPRRMLPFGGDANGNVFCLSVSGPDIGAVYFWDHEAEDGYKAEAGENLTLLASSFEQFISELKPN